MRPAAASFLLLLLSGSASAQAPRPHAPAKAIPDAFPVTRVLLYKNGVGFFEHAGTVTGNGSVSIDFTSAQLNDALQSLTAVDLNGGQIRGADYGSAAPLEQQLKSLPLGLGSDASADDLYASLRGARVQVSGGGPAITGRLLSVEYTTTPGAAGAPPVDHRVLTVVGDTGVVTTVETTARTEVRLLDAPLRSDVARYLQLVASRRSEGLRRLTLRDTGTGTRGLRVSYISEVPVWKATYRILFGASAAGGAAETATLQGWAVVDNTTGMDWTNVELSLIAGAPQSFIQPLSQPYYARRPEIPLPAEAQLAPQTHESGELGKASAGRISTGFGAGQGVGAGLAQSQAAVINGKPHSLNAPVNGSSTSVSVGGPLPDSAFSNGPIDGPAAPSYEDSAAGSVHPETTTTGFDDAFEYKLSTPVTIQKDQSALVPILETKVEAERVTLWSPAQPVPLRALWMRNTSGLTLDRGSFSIVEDGRFGGEGLLEPVHAGEKRLLSYASDQAVHISTDYQHDTRRLQQVTISRGVLTERTVEIAEREYLVRNAAADKRTVLVEQPRRAGWELDSEVKPEETTDAAYRFRVIAAPGETVRLHIGERHTLGQSYQLAGYSEQQLDFLLAATGDDPNLRRELAPLFAAKRRLSELDGQTGANQAALDAISKDQERLRANLQALKGSRDERTLAKRYTEELNAQEDKVGSLQLEQTKLQQQRAEAEQQLAAQIQSLEINDTPPGKS